MQAFVPKHRKPKFDLTLKIIDLNNIPLVCGTCYVKWHLPSSTTAEHRGRTEKALIHDHKATWEYVKTLSVRLTADKSQMLQEYEIQFEIIQEFSEGGRGGRVLLGSIKLSLAEYANRQDEQVAERGPDNDGDEGITRRYLMQESKINSTLKIGILMKQTEGDSNFIAPPLKTPMVFGGIAGVIGTEGGEGDDLGHMPSVTSKTRELSELQDMYRRTLAATWACQAGELPPDKLIEDLFAGGDGGTMKPPPSRVHHATMASTDQRDEDLASFVSASDADLKQTLKPRFVSPKHEHHGSGESGHRRHGNRHDNGSVEAKSNPSNGTTAVSGRASIEQQMQHSRKEHKARSQRSAKEMSEFDLRDDLRSWMISAR